MVPALSNTFRPSARLGLISLFTDESPNRTHSAHAIDQGEDPSKNLWKNLEDVWKDEKEAIVWITQICT